MRAGPARAEQLDGRAGGEEVGQHPESGDERYAQLDDARLCRLQTWQCGVPDRVADAGGDRAGRDGVDHAQEVDLDHVLHLRHVQVIDQMVRLSRERGLD